jgi:peptidoglycan/xylan/chitin deacetylase (PgdA/CDA1 family)
MFDDGWKSQYDVAYKYMKSKDMRGSISIIASEVGNTKYVNMANIYEMYNSKWDILNHTYSHKLLPSMTYDDQKKEIENSIFWFKEKKLDNNLNILIYPEGMYNYNTLKVVKDLYIKSARSILDGYNTNIINNIYEIKVKDVKSFIEVSTVIGWINYAINNNITLILLFHDITNNTTSDMTYRTEDFYQIIDYIYSNNDKINIITYSDWIRAF